MRFLGIRHKAKGISKTQTIGGCSLCLTPYALRPGTEGQW